MYRRTLTLSRIAAAGLLLLAVGRVSAQLAANSPFQPLPTSVPTAPVADSNLKYGGYIETPDGIQYRFSDSSRKGGTFVRLNQADPGLGVTVKQHDVRNNTVVVEYQGRTMTLAEPKSRIVSNGAPIGAMPAPPPSANQPPPVATNMIPAVSQTASVVNPTAADEQRRLDAVAAEVNRRRAMREQAATGAPAPQPVPPQPGSPQQR